MHVSAVYDNVCVCKCGGDLCTSRAIRHCTDLHTHTAFDIFFSVFSSVITDLQLCATNIGQPPPVVVLYVCSCIDAHMRALVRANGSITACILVCPWHCMCV